MEVIKDDPLRSLTIFFMQIAFFPLFQYFFFVFKVITFFLSGNLEPVALLLWLL